MHAGVLAGRCAVDLEGKLWYGTVYYSTSGSRTLGARSKFGLWYTLLITDYWFLIADYWLLITDY